MSAHETFGSLAEDRSGDEKWGAPQPVFDDAWIVFRRISGARLPTSYTTLVTRALRKALTKYAGEPVPEIISGHTLDGAPSQCPHAAYLGLPAVGACREVGELAGLTLVLPRVASEHERTRVHRAIANWGADTREADHPVLTLYLGQAGTLALSSVASTAPPPALRPRTWCRPALRWASVTPVVLDRFPGRLRSGNPQVAARAEAKARAIVARSCERIGLPMPAHVEIAWQSMVPGVPSTREFPPYPGLPGRQRRFFVHAVLTFSMPVTGPVLIGAGRYEGMGLLQPL